MGRNSLSEDEARLIQKADEAKDFVTGDDGFVVYWPTTNNGAFDAWSLRALANELDRRNADWFKHMEDFFVRQGVENLKREAKRHAKQD